MTVQIFGFGLLILSSVYMSFLLLRRANHRICQLEGICRLLHHIKNNIDTLNRPLGEILQSYKSEGTALDGYMEQVRERGLLYASEHGELVIPPTGMDLLRDFSSQIGTGYRDDALRLCTYTINAMEALLNKEREELSKRRRMYKTLPVMSALSLGLLLM